MKNHVTIAVIGMGGVFPDAANPKALWENILKGRDSSREVPRGRWGVNPRRVHNKIPGDEIHGSVDRVSTTRGCFIREPLPDLGDLRISRDFLDRLDPLFHLLLAAGKQAFDDARMAGTDRRRTGVIVGNLVLPTDTLSAISEETLLRTLEEALFPRKERRPYPETHPLNRYGAGLPAGILSKALGLGGDSFTLDAACASSLYAMKLAVDELCAGRADTMLCGGVSRPSCLFTQMGFSQLRALSPTGRAAPFDAQADGLLVGEGAGIFVLKRLSDALHENCNIHGVIRGIGLSNDMGGRLLAPTSEGQLRAMKAAYEEAGWHPGDVDLIECHATGTPVGDAVEFESLKRLWEGADENQTCILGSVKSNIGHLLTAAGAAACMKTLLALKERTLPPSANFNEAPESFEMAKSPFDVLKAPRPWKRRHKDTPRKGAVSAFGFGGINAHVLLEEWRGATEGFVSTVGQNMNPNPSRVAVIGMDANFGRHEGLKSFEACIFKGNTGKPEPRNDSWGVYQASWFKEREFLKKPSSGFFMDAVEIPAGLFRIPPKELHEMLPQQLLMLKTAVGAWRDAGLDAEENTRAGAFVGIGLDPNAANYHVRWRVEEKSEEWARALNPHVSQENYGPWVSALLDAAGPPLTANRTMGGLGSVIASRIAREFSMGGPAFTVSSEESSGLNALKTGVRALQSGLIDRALVGAVEMTGDVRTVLSRNALLPVSGGKTVFSALMGEGAGAVVLKRLEDAVRDGDRIYCVIKGVGASTGGGTQDLLPDLDSYVSSMKRACEEADFLTGGIGYVETHGIPAEDGTEIEALFSYFDATAVHGEDHREFSQRRHALGSVKARIGHTGAASAMASFIKAALCLHHEMLPPLDAAHSLPPELRKPNPFFIPKTPRHWLHDRADGPRRALVGTLSITGNCGHVLLEAFEPKTLSVEASEKRPPLGGGEEGLFVVRAPAPKGILKGLDELKNFVQKSAPSGGMETLARSWWRQSVQTRGLQRGSVQRGSVQRGSGLSAALVSRNPEELLQQIDRLKQSIAADPGKRVGGGRPTLPGVSFQDRVFFNPQPLSHEGQNRICFVFPGSGNNFPDMGRELFVQWPEILKHQHGENLHLRRQYRPDYFWGIDEGYEAPVFGRGSDRRAMIFGHVSLCTGISDLLQSFGISPGFVVGYSLGETAGLFAMRAWSDRDEMLGEIQTSTLFTRELAGECLAARRHWKWPRKKPLDWALFTIDRSMDDIGDLLKNHSYVYPLISNTSAECVIGGERRAVLAFIREMGCGHVPVEGVSIAHCEVVKAVEAAYRELHLRKTVAPPHIKFYSGAEGRSYEVSRESAADAILSHALNGVDFVRTIQAAHGDGARIFLEAGPGASCTRMIHHILSDEPHAARSFCIQGQNPYALMLRGLGSALRRVSP